MSRRFDVEIIPPQRSSVPGVRRPNNSYTSPLVSAPAPPPRGFFAKLRYERAIRDEMQALALYERRAKVERSYWEAQTETFESAVKCRETAFRLATQGELLGIQHEEQLRELRHRSDMAEIQRRAERAQAEASLAEAESNRDAAREVGHSTARQRRDNELLDLQLAAEERRAALRRYLKELDHTDSPPSASAGQIGDLLYEARSELNANGLDTTRIDAAIERLQARE